MDIKINLLELLKHIDPGMTDYQEWVNVGMALKHEGYTAADWDAWSRRDDNRYHPGECFKKWDTFQGTGTPVTGATITQMAKDFGWRPGGTGEGHELDWDAEIGGELVVIDRNWIEGKEIEEPVNWEPVNDLITYLETLFESNENVGYVTSTWEMKDDKTDEITYKPTKGNWDRTAGQLIQELSNCNGDIGAVLGDYRSDVGAWIRFNPLDGQGCKDVNVTDFKYALVESDGMELEKQHAMIQELELPVVCMVHSGRKSIHAIVRIDAGNYEEYRKRVDYLYTVCQKNGFKMDKNNRNPSRLSRMPGVMRNGQKQFLIATNIGKESWTEWQEWIEAINDDLPEPESLTSVWDNLPELSPPLIDGVLRQGHKMLLAGPSKAGKSYALIELCIAVAEGREWLGWNCTRGRILYVNLELDSASCFHRFHDVYKALGWAPDNVDNIDIWNLRGKSVPMDKLAPKLIRRAAKKDYIAVVIDPIYKVITGDENSADQMAHFCNQFDRICTDLGTAVIYCHHHSKGSQGGKRSMDRASGSGVFARDPDALLDLTELELTHTLKKAEENNMVCQINIAAIRRNNMDYFRQHIGEDDQQSAGQMNKHAEKALNKPQTLELAEAIAKGYKLLDGRTAWRIEGTLREFPKFKPVNIWFEYPIHNIDTSGTLTDLEPDGERPPWQKNFSKKKSNEELKKERKESLENAYEACGIDEEVTVKSLAEYMGKSEDTVRRHIKEHGGFWIDNGVIGKK